MAKLSSYLQIAAVQWDDVQDVVRISSQAHSLAFIGRTWQLTPVALHDVQWMLSYLHDFSDTSMYCWKPLKGLNVQLGDVYAAMPSALIREAWPMRILPWLDDPLLRVHEADFRRLYAVLEMWINAKTY
jgi:hypothetical protein